MLTELKFNVKINQIPHLNNSWRALDNVVGIQSNIVLTNIVQLMNESDVINKRF